MKRPTFPLEIKKESCLATIYRKAFTRHDKQGKAHWYVEYRLAWYEDGRRKIETSSDYPALRSRADEVLDDLKEGRRTEAGAIKASERNDYVQAMDLLAPTGQPLHVAVSHYAKAVEILGGDLVIAAAQDYARRHLNTMKPQLVSEVVDEFIADKERQKRSQAYVERLASHLDKFGRSLVMNIASVTAADMDRFLDSLKADGKPVGVRTRDNHADSIVTFYKWAKRKRYVPADFDETDRITRLHRDEDGVIEIYTPEQMIALLSRTDSKLIPFLAIGAFAGLRSSEILRLDWSSDIKLDDVSSCIVVQKGKVKMRGKSRRIVPMTENLKEWLKPHAKPAGPVWEYSVAYLYEMLRELAPRAEAAMRESDPKAKLEWRPNGLRHSFISFRTALVKNVSEVALEAGNSPSIIFSNYRELVTEGEARKWFSIFPPTEPQGAQGGAPLPPAPAGQ